MPYLAKLVVRRTLAQHRSTLAPISVPVPSNTTITPVVPPKRPSDDPCPSTAPTTRTSLVVPVG